MQRRIMLQTRHVIGRGEIMGARFQRHRRVQKHIAAMVVMMLIGETPEQTGQ